MTAPSPGRTLPDIAGHTLLIVEDKFLVADELHRIVTGAGAYVAGFTANVAEAVQVVTERRLDLALLDIDLAGQDVFEVVRALEARGVPFVFVTGFDPQYLGEAYDGYQVVTKPFTTARIIAAVADALRPGTSPPG